MKILNIHLQTSSLELKEPFTTALRSVTSIDEVILTLCTSEFTAYGSAPATLAITGDDIEKIRKDLENLVLPAFKDKELLGYEESFKILHALSLCKSAQACMDIALHDLFAQEKGESLYKFLGGSQRELNTLYTISIDSPQNMLIQAQRVYKEGYRLLKIKLDAHLEENIQRVKLLHENLKTAFLFLDINQAFDLKQSYAFMKALNNIPIVLLEQPLKAKNLKDMAQLTALKSIPILADESVFSLRDAKRCYEEKACDFINIKLMKCGGIYEAKKILDFCQEKNLSCMMGCMLEGAISVSAALHLAYTYDNVIFCDLDGPTLAKNNPIQGGIEYQGMAISLRTHKGLGLSL